MEKENKSQSIFIIEVNWRVEGVFEKKKKEKKENNVKRSGIGFVIPFHSNFENKSAFSSLGWSHRVPFSFLFLFPLHPNKFGFGKELVNPRYVIVHPAAYFSGWDMKWTCNKITCNLLCNQKAHNTTDGASEPWK